MSRSNKEILQADNLVKFFEEDTGSLVDFLKRRKRVIKAVDGVNIGVPRSQTLALVGESGCGKSTLGRIITRLIKPSSGEIFFDNKSLSKLSRRQLMPFQRLLQIVFQNPYSSLNPRKRVGQILHDPLKLGSQEDGQLESVEKLLEVVGLDSSFLSKYPHEMSGGQRQRIAIARAFATRPKVIVFDEVTSALDVSVQAQIINLLIRLQKEREISYVFISHDLSVVRQLAHQVSVMYLGRIVEKASADVLFKSPKHPYTQILLSAIPTPNFRASWNPFSIKGEPPSPINVPKGCRFNPRCPRVFEKCRTNDPKMIISGTDHEVSCFLYE
tara:strand:+ start:1406 stop:2389 length:984 start_codon:yes stop_codon:yes gene_type:complete